MLSPGVQEYSLLILSTAVTLVKIQSKWRNLIPSTVLHFVHNIFNVLNYIVEHVFTKLQFAGSLLQQFTILITRISSSHCSLLKNCLTPDCSFPTEVL